MDELYVCSNAPDENPPATTGGETNSNNSVLLRKSSLRWRLRKTTMSTRYHIRVKGHLDLTWSDWFEGLKISYEPDGSSDLFGMIKDQAKLISILTKMHNLNLELISVNPEVTEEDQHD